MAQHKWDWMGHRLCSQCGQYRYARYGENMSDCPGLVKWAEFNANLFRAQRCSHGLEAQQCSECCDAITELRPPPEHAAIGSLHWVGRKDIPSLHAVWRWWPEAGGGYWVDDLGGRREPNIEGAIYRYLGPAECPTENGKPITEARAQQIVDESAVAMKDAAELLVDSAARIAALEAALDRANEVCRQTQEIVDLRGREIAQLRGQLQMLFKRAAVTPVVSRETPSDAEAFPINAMKWSR